MAESIFYMTLDIDDGFSPANMNLRQGESGRQLALSLSQSGKAFPVGAEHRAALAGTRADGEVFLTDCRIENSTVFCTLSTIHTATAGTVRAELRLYGPEDVLIASPAFSLTVAESAMEEGEIVEGEAATALTAMISEADTAIRTMTASTLTAAEAAYSEDGGEPAVSAALLSNGSGQTLSLDFANLRGERGEAGPAGPQGIQGPPGSGVSEEDAMAALLALDMLPAVTDSGGAVLTDLGGNIPLRY